MKRGNKTGQFYLCSAIILITIVVGFVVISNYSKTRSFTKIYDLGEELGIEGGNVLDHGTFSGVKENVMLELLKDFIESYSEYGEIEKIYFLFGDEKEITVIGYQELAGIIKVDIDEDEPRLLEMIKKTPSSGSYSPNKNEITILIDGEEYRFDLNPGENFYFVIFQEVEGEEHVAKN